MISRHLRAEKQCSAPVHSIFRVKTITLYFPPEMMPLVSMKNKKKRAILSQSVRQRADKTMETNPYFRNKHTGFLIHFCHGSLSFR